MGAIVPDTIQTAQSGPGVHRAVETLSTNFSTARHLVFALSHFHNSRGLGNADILVHCHYRQLMSTFLQRESREQLIVERLCSLGAIHPRLQRFILNRRVAQGL